MVVDKTSLAQRLPVQQKLQIARVPLQGDFVGGASLRQCIRQVLAPAWNGQGASEADGQSAPASIRIFDEHVRPAIAISGSCPNENALCAPSECECEPRLAKQGMLGYPALDISAWQMERGHRHCTRVVCTGIATKHASWGTSSVSDEAC